jgi:hypothetical protein
VLSLLAAEPLRAEKYPELPADAAIEGRQSVATQKGFRDSGIYLQR